MMLKAEMLKNSEYDHEYVFILSYTRVCWSIFYCYISTDIAGE